MVHFRTLSSCLLLHSSIQCEYPMYIVHTLIFVSVLLDVPIYSVGLHLLLYLWVCSWMFLYIVRISYVYCKSHHLLYLWVCSWMILYIVRIYLCILQISSSLVFVSVLLDDPIYSVGLNILLYLWVCSWMLVYILPI